MAAPPSSAQAASSQEALAFLNTQRQANGIPSDVYENPAQTTGCRNHNYYMSLNGFGHGEDPSKPGYTPEGNYQNGAGGWEVLARPPPPWSTTTNPWDTAPLHLFGMFNPNRTFAGADESFDFACMRLAGWRSGPAAPEFYAYTADYGPSGVPFEERAAEGPYTPQELVGIPKGQVTGPNLLLFSLPWRANLHAQTASLIGPSGPVEVRMAEEAQGGFLLRGGAVMIPVRPLQPQSHYQAAVTWQDDQGPVGSQTLAFDTAAAPPAEPGPETANPAPAPTCRTVRSLHKVRYRQRYRDARGRWRLRWRTKPHLHRQTYRDRHGRKRVRLVKHWITKRVCS